MAADKGGCKILTGTLDDPYTGKTITFERGAATNAKVQIDHIIPLALAWDAGVCGRGRVSSPACNLPESSTDSSYLAVGLGFARLQCRRGSAALEV
ncbi:HNH endonuclease domain-containing protein [Microbacterium pullorum]|uniref:HNH endonuclease domain-containing protein n=1 Tax=Microbacterium pullorum TaxID=2762236 RepID=UPI00296AC480|nr:HNH endonuclease domain-containing protein [Microbacterium pullorum]